MAGVYKKQIEHSDCRDIVSETSFLICIKDVECFIAGIFGSQRDLQYLCFPRCLGRIVLWQVHVACEDSCISSPRFKAE